MEGVPLVGVCFLMAASGYCLSLLWLLTMSGFILWSWCLVTVVENVCFLFGHSIRAMTLYLPGPGIWPMFWLLYCVMVSGYCLGLLYLVLASG